MSGVMKALVLQRPGEIVLETRAIPEPGLHDVLVRVHRVGVCGSDVHYYTHGKIGPFVVESPLVLGHEMAGVIERVGASVRSRSVGQRVAVEPGIPDRICDWCRAGRYNLCPNVQFMATPPVDGAFAEYVIVPEDFAYPLPDNVSLDEGAMMEPLSVAVYAAHRSGLRPGQTVIVLGAGPIGLLTLQVARAAGAGSIGVVDINANRLKLAHSLGATQTVDAGNGDLVGQADVVFDCAGSAKTAAMAVHLAERGGKVTMIGLPPEDNFPYPLVAAMAKEIDIVTVFRYANVYPSSIALVAQGRVDVKALVTHRFSLERAEEALVLSHRRTDNVVKAMIDVS
ncbi:MAG TPA: NAD(P)-dependent alcohol dehydrogenase [Candidatus Baltobacteraceae bacterium]|jgi:L-iditol 2-dehydrogenase|nr:NAD(P)-dependent alcohol dehydrogenase [Candidatus Baltobacteraceae bacterium]